MSFFSFSFIFYSTNYHLQVIYTTTKCRKRTTTIDNDADNPDNDNQRGWWQPASRVARDELDNEVDDNEDEYNTGA